MIILIRETQQNAKKPTTDASMQESWRSTTDYRMKTWLRSEEPITEGSDMVTSGDQSLMASPGKAT